MNARREPLPRRGAPVSSRRASNERHGRAHAVEWATRLFDACTNEMPGVSPSRGGGHPSRQGVRPMHALGVALQRTGAGLASMRTRIRGMRSRPEREACGGREESHSQCATSMHRHPGRESPSRGYVRASARTDLPELERAHPHRAWEGLIAGIAARLSCACSRLATMGTTSAVTAPTPTAPRRSRPSCRLPAARRATDRRRRPRT